MKRRAQLDSPLNSDRRTRSFSMIRRTATVALWEWRKTKNVFEFLQANPSVRIHYTPTYSSWLNQVEIWFSKIHRDIIARGIFVSVKDLDRKLLRYIRSYNKKAKPFKWTYAAPDRRIRPTKKSM